MYTNMCGIPDRRLYTSSVKKPKIKDWFEKWWGLSSMIMFWEETERREPFASQQPNPILGCMPILKGNSDRFGMPFVWVMVIKASLPSLGLYFKFVVVFNDVLKVWQELTNQVDQQYMQSACAGKCCTSKLL